MQPAQPSPRVHRDASNGKALDNYEINRLLTTVDKCTDRFGQSSPDQVRADGDGGPRQSEQNQGWRHECAATHAGETDKKSDNKAQDGDLKSIFRQSLKKTTDFYVPAGGSAGSRLSIASVYFLAWEMSAREVWSRMPEAAFPDRKENAE